MTIGARLILFIASVAILAVPLRADAEQEQKIPRIGVFAPTVPATGGHLVDAFRQGLRELGYVEGKTFVLEVRYGEGKSERFPELARELISRKVDVIVVSTDVAIAAVKKETRTIPIVMTFSIDPAGPGSWRASRGLAATSPGSAASRRG
jgi:putative ABC transport system substrate-binding protein